jgi:hypothetical protein
VVKIFAEVCPAVLKNLSDADNVKVKANTQFGGHILQEMRDILFVYVGSASICIAQWTE